MEKHGCWRAVGVSALTQSTKGTHTPDNARPLAVCAPALVAKDAASIVGKVWAPLEIRVASTHVRCAFVDQFLLPGVVGREGYGGQPLAVAPLVSPHDFLFDSRSRVVMIYARASRFHLLGHLSHVECAHTFHALDHQILFGFGEIHQVSA